MKKIFRIATIGLVVLIALVTLSNTSGKYFEISKQIELFANLYKEINTHYVDNLDPASLMRTGIDAMLESLDPYTNYISETDIEGYRYITEGKYNGIGANVKQMGDYITITELYKDSPADKAGIKIGDQVISVDGKSTKGKTRNEVDVILKGFPGSEVELGLNRPGSEKPIAVTLVRDEVQVPNVSWSGVVGDGIGYIALTTFTRNAGRNVANALVELKQDSVLKGIILDLRDNGGGLLNEAVNVCNIFIPKGEQVVTTKGKVIDRDRSYKTLNAPVDKEIPLVILINKRSASASEIVSGVIQDFDRGVLMGQQSYGKGLVQNTRDIGYNSKVKLTTAKYYIPSGRCIQAVEYDNGEPVDIPDEKRAQFKTRKGRKVLDGGGVRPDVILDHPEKSNIIKSLVQNDMIFKFATEYTLKHSEIDQPGDFEFVRFEDFVSFLKGESFDFDSETEKSIEKLKMTAEKEEYLEDLQARIDALMGELETKQSQELEAHKQEIVRLIENQIVSRYYMAKGKIQHNLRKDPEILEAVQVLNDPVRHQSLLAGK